MVRPSDTSPSDTEPASVSEAPILHVDLDAFFASVEVLDDPQLRGLPVAVGGAGDRGVIASASYEARRYGVFSAMPSVVAKRRCPELIILPGRFDRYEEYSNRFQSIVGDLTPVYEPLGLDEVFADLSSLGRLRIQPVAAARALRDRIREELSIESGIGVARSKLFAKLASKRAKPRVVDGRLVPGLGVVWVDRATENQWLTEMPVRSLWGVGPATAARLSRLGVTHVRELAEIDESTLRGHFGPSLAHSLVQMAHGIDDRPVVAHRGAKSIGHEETFAVSLDRESDIERTVLRHAGVVARALRTSGQVARTISVVMRFDDLTSVGRSQSLGFGVDDEGAIGEVAVALVESIDRRGAVRLLGVSTSSLAPRSGNQVQLSFDLAIHQGVVGDSQFRQANREALNDAIDDLRRRFGKSAIARGLDVGPDGIEVPVQRGSHAFGPVGESDIHRP